MTPSIDEEASASAVTEEEQTAPEIPKKAYVPAEASDDPQKVEIRTTSDTLVETSRTLDEQGFINLKYWRWLVKGLVKFIAVFFKAIFEVIPELTADLIRFSYRITKEEMKKTSKWRNLSIFATGLWFLAFITWSGSWLFYSDTYFNDQVVQIKQSAFIAMIGLFFISTYGYYARALKHVT